MIARKKATERKLMWMRFEQMGICFALGPFVRRCQLHDLGFESHNTKRFRGLLQIYEWATDTFQ